VRYDDKINTVFLSISIILRNFMKLTLYQHSYISVLAIGTSVDYNKKYCGIL